MRDTAPLTILPIHPLPADAVPTPLNGSTIRRMAAHRAGSPVEWQLPPEASDRGGRRLRAHLDALAAEHATPYLVCRDVIAPTLLDRLTRALADPPCDLRLSVECALAGPVAVDHRPAAAGGIIQIGWRPSGSLPAPAFFKAFARMGVWNHLRLDARSATPQTCRVVAGQPTVFHSWETTGERGASSPADFAYRGVRPLPGRPLWQALSDPVERLLLADRLTRDGLQRLRIDDDGETLYTIGGDLAYYFVPPQQLPAGYLDEICAMVAAGGTVAATHVRSNLEQAFLIGYVTERGVIVGNSSLKNPRPVYIEAVRRQSGLDLTGFVERGYTSVRTEYRGLGIGTRLLAGLTARAGDRRIFSVIAEDNEATKVIARRNRTRQVATYFSEKAGKAVGIWMPEWMIGDDGERNA